MSGFGWLAGLPDLDGALCQEVDAELWFPEKGGPSATAKRLCRACPVIAECLTHALANPEQGIWGGTTEKERRELRRALPIYKESA